MTEFDTRIRHAYTRSKSYMSDTAKIREIIPNRAIPSGEIEILVEGLQLPTGEAVRCLVNGVECRVAGASSRRVVVSMPDIGDSTAIVQIDTSDQESNGFVVTTGKRVVSEMHIVANPATDPSDDALIVTRSGARGQQ
ncbi:MAG: IPT/TIG domain-containing protein, partial [bacterium]|nr:IPT/TIG domain-containing protein [bacterium]